MAKLQPSPDRDIGAPIPRDAIDPDLIKLQRTGTKIGIVSALGIVVLCGYFLVRLSPDRAFGGNSDKPTAVALADVLAGTIATDEFIELEASPLVAHAIRSVKAKGDLGLRLVPARGTGDRLWLALSGDGWTKPVMNKRYEGRLRKLDDLPFADAVRAYASENPRPVFASAAAARAGFANDKVRLVTGDDIALSDEVRVAFDVVEPDECLVIASFTERVPSAKAWLDAFAREQLPVTQLESQPGDEAVGRVRFAAKLSIAEATNKLETASLWAARVEPVASHRATTWGELKRAAAPRAIPADVDLVGIYTARAIPEHAYVLLANESPEDYWYVMPITCVLAVLGALFAWALLRAIRRDLLPSR